jgi:hypothetical protein
VWVAKDHYAIEDMEFSIRSTDEAFLELVRGYLGPFRVEGESDASDGIVFQVDAGQSKTLPGGKVVRQTANLFAGGIRIYCGPRWEDMAGRMIVGMRDMHSAYANEFARLRAVGAVVDGKAMLLPSLPNPHLPALAALLARGGAGYLGDEIVKLDPIMREVHGIPFPILVDVSDLGLLPELHARGRRATPIDGDQTGNMHARTPRRPVPVEQVGGYRATPAVLGRIVFPVFRPGEETRLEAIASSEAVFHFLEALLNAHIWGERAMLLARDLVETVPVERIVIGALPDAAELLLGDRMTA